MASYPDNLVVHQADHRGSQLPMSWVSGYCTRVQPDGYCTKVTARRRAAESQRITEEGGTNLVGEQICSHPCATRDQLQTAGCSPLVRLGPSLYSLLWPRWAPSPRRAHIHRHYSLSACRPRPHDQKTLRPIALPLLISFET